MKVSKFIGVCTVTLLSTTGAWAADIDAGQTYFNKNCANCHGKTAKGMASFPSLRDRDAAYIADRLETYRARGKVGSNSALMYSHAGKLSDEMIANIAGYLGSKFGNSKSVEKSPKAKAKPKEVKADAAEVKQPSKPKTDAKKVENPRTIACAQERGETLGECTYRVKQDKKGKITVTATFDNGFKRMLFFKGGQFLKASATMSGVGTDTDWELQDGLHLIRVDDQRYEVPEAVFAALEVAKSEPETSKSSTPAVKTKPKPKAKTFEKGAVETADASADVAKGKKHFRKNCRACHGSKAQGVASYPRLAGQPADYLVMRLNQYRAGEKIGPNTPLMAPRAKKLSDADIANIVAYIGTFE